jgi:hypothetical protein
MKKILLALAFTLALAPLVSAHEGHTKKILGTVTAINGDHLEVTIPGGKASTIMLDGKTKILKGQATHKAGDIKVGNRVVITASDVKDQNGKVMWMAKQIVLGSCTVAAPKK